jgi:DNA-binding CsgD family transcriptional regulator
MSGSTPGGGHHPLDRNLSGREREVLALLVQRLTDKEIAAALSISPRTAMSHVLSILTKLGAANRREAAAIALRLGLVEPQHGENTTAPPGYRLDRDLRGSSNSR